MSELTVTRNASLPGGTAHVPVDVYIELASTDQAQLDLQPSDRTTVELSPDVYEAFLDWFEGR